jgi:hypothetical protein
MEITIAHFQAQPSVEQRLVRELATGRFIAQAQNRAAALRPAGSGQDALGDWTYPSEDRRLEGVSQEGHPWAHEQGAAEEGEVG